MSDYAFGELTKNVSFLNYEQTLLLMKLLVDNLQRTTETEEPDWLEETFALMDSHPVSSNGQKWTREELYVR
ncbi:MAG: hypothetical protein IKQ61_04505 [Spirochaetales bacterium]|nr:hypothetical protein [Spirochaetales bacterium]